MSQFEPVRFVDVNLEGQFWRERLETVLTRTIPSQHVQLGKHGILESLTLPNPPPPLRFPRNHHDFTVQVFWDSDVGKWIEAASYALSHRRDRRHRGQDRGDHRRSRKGAGAGRLSQLLVSAARAGKPLDQPSRQPRALQSRPSARGRASPISWRPAGAGCSTSSNAMSTMSARHSGQGRTRSTAIAAIRRSSWR